ncbi:flagellar filament capping protein FliD [Trinickia sp. YCB016]
MSTTATSTSASAASSALAQAAQSIISGSTKSSLDVNSLVTALVNAKTAGQQATITNKQTSDNTILSAIGSLQSAMSSLQTSLSGLTDGSALQQLSATASGSGITATVATGSGAVAGTYSVNVTQIAQSNVISSGAYSSSATLGTGNLTVGVGSSSMTIALNSSNNTLAGVAAAINGASNNPGVSATVVTGSDGQHLVLTSTSTGAANTVSISAGTGVDSGLNTASFTQVTAGQDAKLSIAGSTVTSASNTVTGALTGVTLNLTSAAVGTTQTLTVAGNTTAATTAINNFVTAYNSWVTTASGLSTYTAASGSTSATAGPLLGDAMLNTATNDMASMVSSGITVGGKTYSLSSIGLNLQPDGTISVDSTALQTALTTNSSAVSAIFNSTNGIGEQLNAYTQTYTESGGQFAQRTQALNSDLQSLTQQQSTLTAYAASLTSQYNAQFTALNNLMTQMQNNTTYLDQLFGGNGSSGTLNKSA